MMVLEPSALQLRFRDDVASEPHAPPDVAAFLRSSSVSADPRPLHDDELGVLPGAGAADPDGPVTIFLRQPEFGIPAPGYDHRLPELGSWAIRPTTFGWIAHVPATRGPGPRRAAQVLAGCLALALPTDALAAAPAIPPPPTQVPASQSTPAPQQPKKADPAAAPSPSPSPASPSPASPPAATDPLAASPEPEPAVAPSPEPLPAVTAVNASAAVTDAAWEGVDGFDVIVELKGGKVLRGRVGAVQTDTFTLIDGTTGQILVIPKSGVASLRAYIPPPIPNKTGTGLIAGGSILTALGGPVFITGVVFIGLCPSCVELHLPMLIVGGGALGGGIPMITRGLQRRTAFQKAIQEHRIAPSVSRTPYGGWAGVLQIRF